MFLLQRIYNLLKPYCVQGCIRMLLNWNIIERLKGRHCHDFYSVCFFDGDDNDDDNGDD